MKTFLRKILIGLAAKLAVTVLWALLTMEPVEPVLMMEPALIWVQAQGIGGAVSG